MAGSKESLRGLRRSAQGGATTWADRIVLYALVGAGLLSIAAAPGAGTGANEVQIEGDAGYERIVSLEADARFEVPGPLGTTVVEVAGGAVRVVDSPCRQKICQGMGAIEEPGEMSVCVPNRVVVVVRGDSRGSTDAVTR